jgi:hypothetical protein
MTVTAAGFEGDGGGSLGVISLVRAFSRVFRLPKTDFTGSPLRNLQNLDLRRAVFRFGTILLTDSRGFQRTSGNGFGTPIPTVVAFDAGREPR